MMKGLARTSTSPRVLSAFYYAHGPEPRDLFGESGVVNDVHHGINVFICFGDFFQNSVSRVGTQNDSLFFQFSRFRADVAPAFRRRPRKPSARAMTDRAERFLGRRRNA